jgi:hypothetical protein
MGVAKVIPDIVFTVPFFVPSRNDKPYFSISVGYQVANPNSLI